MHSLSAERKALRKKIRAARKALPEQERKLAARRVARVIANGFHLYPGQRVAIYSPLPDELDTAPLLELLRRHRCKVYLPRLVDLRARRMRFFPVSPSMRPNHLGILEPEGAASLHGRWLNLVLVPLVGFDLTGMRLGMGAGYYDRAFAFRRSRQTWRGPKLIGIAYAFQRIDRIEAAAHDVRLDAIATDEGVLQCPTG
jgi:5-formyltetrahydrofolate cyclo-ligase